MLQDGQTILKRLCNPKTKTWAADAAMVFICSRISEESQGINMFSRARLTHARASQDIPPAAAQ